MYFLKIHQIKQEKHPQSSLVTTKLYFHSKSGPLATIISNHIRPLELV